MTTVLKVLEQFSAGGHEYLKDHVIPLSDVESWPETSLERRLVNGFVTYDTVEQEPKKPRVKGETVSI